MGGVIRENAGLVLLGLTGAFFVSLSYAMEAGKRGAAERDAKKPPAQRGEASAQPAGDRPVGPKRGSP